MNPRRRALLAAGAAGAIFLLAPGMAGLAAAGPHLHSTHLHGTLLHSTHLRRAVVLRMPPNAAVTGGFLFGVTCLRAGSCVAGGSYTDNTDHGQAMVITESGGHWARAIEVRLPGNALPDPTAEVNSVACTSPGNCVAAGYYNGSSLFQGFIAKQTHGSWGRARQITLPANSAASPDYQLNSVACTGPGACVVLGSYQDAAGGFEAMAATQSKGSWARARELTMPANARANPDAFFISLACPRAGSCEAIGDYTDKSGTGQLAAATESGGTWRTATQVRLPVDAATNPDAGIDSIACTGVGSCVAVGDYKNHSAVRHSIIVTQSHGSWARASRFIPRVPAGAAASPQPFLSAIACPRAGSCIATGSYIIKAGGFAAMLVTESAGRWNLASQILPPSNAATGSNLNVSTRAVACAADGYCAAVGNYSDKSTNLLPIAATS